MRPFVCIAAVVLLLGSGCVSPAFIANKAGFLAGTGYLAVNNPPAEEVGAVKTVLSKVNKYVGTLEPTGTFAGLYKPISEEISAELSGTTKILALSVVRTALDGLDNLFLAHPSWAEKKETVVELTTQFVAGVNQSFALFASSKEVRANMARLRTASAKAYRAANTP